MATTAAFAGGVIGVVVALVNAAFDASSISYFVAPGTASHDTMNDWPDVASATRLTTGAMPVLQPLNVPVADCTVPQVATVARTKHDPGPLSTLTSADVVVNVPMLVDG